MEKVLEKEIIEINEPKERKMKKSLVKKGAMALALALTLSGPVYKTNETNNVAVVEAASKDKKKPKVTLKGKKKLSAEKGKNVTIPQTTYSDNKTKKKKLKVAVTVKKGKKNYSDIAKKIKKATLNGKTVKVKFPETGTYKIATTITDEAKNKATATRTVTVTSSAKDTKQKEVTMPDMSKYGTMTKINVGGVEYNVLTNVSEDQKHMLWKAEYNYQEKSAEKIFVYDIGSSNKNYYMENYKFLEYFGKIKVIDGYGVDCSNTIFLREPSKWDMGVEIYFVDSKGVITALSTVSFCSYEYAIDLGACYIDEENKVAITGDVYNMSYDNKQSKKYLLKNTKKEC